ncbi:hypothetical protein ABLN86_03250 [Mycobacterium tuberculosis]
MTALLAAVPPADRAGHRVSRINEQSTGIGDASKRRAAQRSACSGAACLACRQRRHLLA